MSNTQRTAPLGALALGFVQEIAQLYTSAELEDPYLVSAEELLDTLIGQARKITAERFVYSPKPGPHDQFRGKECLVASDPSDGLAWIRILPDGPTILVYVTEIQPLTEGRPDEE